MDDELTACLALNRVPGIGPVAFAELFLHFSSAVDVFKARRTQLTSVPCITDKIADSLLKGIEATGVDEDVLWQAEAPEHHIIFLHQQAYPEQLARIHRPPPVLFLKGNPDLLYTPQISIVGSRNPTPGGVENARAFSAELASCGLTITSGLAAGIDGAAHLGTFDVGEVSGQVGRTIAVAATGLDRIYPSQHRELAHRIVENGLLVSEFPVGTGPLQGNFPRRNRIISGLSLGTLVVEAAKQSGSLISARYAMEQDREVFAIPGSIHSPQSRGCHWLIKQGAKLVETAEDIVDEILLMLPQQDTATDHGKEDKRRSGDVRPKLTETEQQLMDAMGYDPVTLDTLVLRTGMLIDTLLESLSQLEMQGRLDSLPGGKFCRNTTHQ